MAIKTRVPVATIDVTGQSYGGAYWEPTEFQITMTDSTATYGGYPQAHYDRWVEEVDSKGLSGDDKFPAWHRRNYPDWEGYNAPAIIQLLNTSGGVLDEVQLSPDQAHRLVAIVGQARPDTQVPNLEVTARLTLGDDSSENVELTWQLAEVAAWLEFFIGDETWDPDNEEWEY